MSTGADTAPVMPESPQLAPSRLFEVSQAAGFLATSRDELNEAHTLLNITETVTHLDEIRLHQIKYKIPDPMEAVFSVVEGYRDFARKARADKNALWDLDDELAAFRSATPLTSMARAGLGYNESTRHMTTGVPQFVRRHDLWLLAQGQPLGKSAFFPLYPTLHSKDHKGPIAADAYTSPHPQKPVITRIQAVTGSVRLHEARKTINAAVTDQQSRQDFWADRLKRARLHPMVTQTAEAMLRSLSIMPQA